MRKFVAFVSVGILKHSGLAPALFTNQILTIKVKTSLNTLLLCCLLLLPTFAVEAQTGTQTKMRQEGSFLTVEGTIEVPASRLAAWSVLTDYSRFPEFVPGILSNRILEQRKDIKLIEQRGMIVSNNFQMPFQGIIQVEENKRDGVPEGMKILFLSGPLKDVQGEWNIQPGKLLGLTYRMRMDLSKTPFPPPMAVSIAEQQVQTWVDAFSREIKRIK